MTERRLTAEPAGQVPRLGQPGVQHQEGQRGQAIGLIAEDGGQAF